MSIPTIAITDPDGLHSREMATLRAELHSLGARVVDQPLAGTLELCYSSLGLTLRQHGHARGEEIRVDFAHPTFLYRLAHGGGRKQPMARAMGLKPGYSPSILDATAGLGRDGFILAALGCRLMLCERSPLIRALLMDGLTRALADPRLMAIAGRISLHVGDSQRLLATLAPGESPEVVYLDPMFPHRAKSALVKKEMRLVRAVVGDDADSSDLLRVAMVHAGQRVVCKRPSQAPPLAGPAPSFAITTPKHRFDVYLRRE